MSPELASKKTVPSAMHEQHEDEKVVYMSTCMYTVKYFFGIGNFFGKVNNMF